jgi:hypothetical protein
MVVACSRIDLDHGEEESEEKNRSRREAAPDKLRLRAQS